MLEVRDTKQVLIRFQTHFFWKMVANADIFVNQIFLVVGHIIDKNMIILRNFCQIYLYHFFEIDLFDFRNHFV